MAPSVAGRRGTLSREGWQGLVRYLAPSDLVTASMNSAVAQSGGANGIYRSADLQHLAAAGMSIVKQVNERSLNLQVFQDVEDSVLDLYSAVRNGYLQRRRRSIEEADAARQAEWHPPSRAVAAR